MKKALIISAFVVTFILGIVLSEPILRGFNAIFGKDTFATRAGVKKQLEQDKAELDKKLKEADQKYGELSGDMTRREANMNSLIKKIETDLNADAVKGAILTTPANETSGKGRIFLDGGSAEGQLSTSTTDDPMVNKFHKAFNDKAKDILDVAKGILKDKISQLNQELLRTNDQLKDRNVQLIGKVKEVQNYQQKVDNMNKELTDRNQQLTDKVKEVEGYQKKVDNINKELTDRNQQLTEKVKEVEGYQNKVDSMNKELTDRNKQLQDKLDEVEQYKKELDRHKQTINDLEGIKSNLQKTVGVLETKIEEGRLKVSFKGDILFQSGKHELRPEGRQLLESVYKILKESTKQNDIFVAGHTDNVPIRPDALDRYDSNWTLSTYRAIEVVKCLVEKGLSPKHMTAAGYGEFKPVADNVSDEGKSKNRRVELFLIPRIIKRQPADAN